MAKDFMVKESELDQYQIRLLNKTLDKSMVVSGCAGSGKSVIALQKAKRIQNEKGNDYQVIVFTKALCNYMNAGREELGLINPFYYHYNWKRKLGMPQADYVIVDEIQDFTKDEINEFIAATRKNFFFFGDTAQSIYDGLKDTLSIEEIAYISKASPLPLYYNYRLPKPIAKITQNYIGIDVEAYDEETYKSQENEIPRFIRYDSLEEQIIAIAKTINNKSLTDVGILIPHNHLIPEISKILDKEGIFHEIRYNDKEGWKNSQDTLDFTTPNPKLMTYHSAKGLQFETVFLPCVEPATENNVRKSLYVAMTRSYRYLYVFYNYTLPYPLSEVPTELYKNSEIDEFEEI